MGLLVSRNVPSGVKGSRILFWWMRCAAMDDGLVATIMGARPGYPPAGMDTADRAVVPFEPEVVAVL